MNWLLKILQAIGIASMLRKAWRDRKLSAELEAARAERDQWKLKWGEVMTELEMLREIG